MWRRPGDIAIAWAASFALALPLALGLRASLVDSLGHSEAGERMLHGWDGLWFRTFSAQATGLEKSFEPGVVGIGGLLSGLDALVTGTLGGLPGAVLAAGLAYMLLWLLLSAGMIARAARPHDAPGLLRAGAASVLRLVPLSLLSLLAYGATLLLLLPFLNRFVEVATADVIDERVAFVYAVAKFGALWLVLGAIGVVVDYAKVLLVVDSRCGTMTAVSGALSWIRRRPLAVGTIGVGILGSFVAVVGVYWVIAPGVVQINPFQILMAFLVGQASIAARIGIRAWGHAARVVLIVGIEQDGQTDGAGA